MATEEFDFSNTNPEQPVDNLADILPQEIQKVCDECGTANTTLRSNGKLEWYRVWDETHGKITGYKCSRCYQREKQQRRRAANNPNYRPYGPRAPVPLGKRIKIVLMDGHVEEFASVRDVVIIKEEKVQL